MNITQKLRYLYFWPYSRRQKDLLRIEPSRRACCLDHYYSCEAKKKIAQILQNEIHDESAIYIPGFQPTPTDSFADVYGIEQEDLLDMLERMEKKVSESSSLHRHSEQISINTVGDVIEYFYSRTKHTQ